MRSRDRHVLALVTLFFCAPVVAYLAWDLGEAGKVSLKTPFALLMLVAAPLAFWVLLLRPARRVAPLAYSGAGLLSRFRRGMVSRLWGVPGILRVLALTLMVLALARPQTRDRGGSVEVEGIDIILALDLSYSMEAGDLYPNRLEAAKKVLDRFISRRKSDRIGLVVFGREAFTDCPLTLDYSVLRSMLAELQLKIIDGRSTAIGNALGVSLARLRKSDAKSRVVILVTDGDNNAGNVTPEQAARYAQAMGVKVYTILMGPKDGEVTVRDPLGRPVQVKRQYPVNPKLLQRIADMTGGRAYRATDRRALEQNFESILNELQKSTRKDVAAVFIDAYRPFLVIALLLLGLEILLRLTRFREFP